MAFKASCQGPLLKEERTVEVVVTDLRTVGLLFSFCL